MTFDLTIDDPYDPYTDTVDFSGGEAIVATWDVGSETIDFEVTFNGTDYIPMKSLDGTVLTNIGDDGMYNIRLRNCRIKAIASASTVSAGIF